MAQGMDAATPHIWDYEAVRPEAANFVFLTVMNFRETRL